MSLTADTVDADGNITFVEGEGVDIRIVEQTDAGVVINLAVQERFLNVGRGPVLRKDLGVDPDNATGMRILLTPSELSFIQSTTTFTYTDETGAVPISLWEGIIYRRT